MTEIQRIADLEAEVSALERQIDTWRQHGAVLAGRNSVLETENERLRGIETALAEIVPGIRAFLDHVLPTRDDGTYMWAQTNSRGDAPGISAGQLRRLLAALEAKP